MNNPLLLVVTGSLASGKTTLSQILADKINCPLSSRDQLKEGLINTLNVEHSQLDKQYDKYVYETFFDTIDLLISKRVSIVIEAAPSYNNASEIVKFGTSKTSVDNLSNIITNFGYKVFSSSISNK